MANKAKEFVKRTRTVQKHLDALHRFLVENPELYKDVGLYLDFGDVGEADSKVEAMSIRIAALLTAVAQHNNVKYRRR